MIDWKTLKRREKISVVFLTLIFILGIASAINDQFDKPKAPAAQMQLIADAKSLIDEYNSIEASQNKFAMDALIPRIEAFRQHPNRRAENWLAKIDSVDKINDGSGTQIKAVFETEVFWIYLSTADAKGRISQLAHDDEIIFTGNLGDEQSITDHGGISNPEFQVYLESLSLPAKSIEISSPFFNPDRQKLVP